MSGTDSIFNIFSPDSFSVISFNSSLNLFNFSFIFESNNSSLTALNILLNYSDKNWEFNNLPIKEFWYSFNNPSENTS